MQRGTLGIGTLGIATLSLALACGAALEFACGAALEFACGAALEFACGAALAQEQSRAPRSDAPTAAMVGAWRGSYTCPQGPTGLTLSIEKQAGATFSGFFHFYPTRANPDPKEGCFAITGTVDHAGRVVIKAGSWAMRPDGYETVDLDGALDAAAQGLDGAVVFSGGAPAVCERFSVKRDSVEPATDIAVCGATGRGR